MKILLSSMTLAVIITGCTQFTFQPADTPPQTEHEKRIHAQQQALSMQERTTLNK